MTGRGKHPLAHGDEAQHAGPGLDANIDIGGIARGIEPDLIVHGRRQRPAQGAIKRAEKGRSPGGRQALAFAEIDRELHVAVSRIGERRKRRIVLARGLEQFRHDGDIAGDAFGQAAGHRFPMLFEKRPGDQPLHDSHGHHEDQQGPAKQAFRQISFQRSQCALSPDPRILLRRSACIPHRVWSVNEPVGADRLPACGADASSGHRPPARRHL